MTQRPLSPHLQIYKWQITSVSSILHRLTGMALSIGFFFLAYWLIAMVLGDEYYLGIRHFFQSFLGKFILFGWTWSFFYHLCNGIRHLFWDFGLGFQLRTVHLSGWLAIGGSFVFTLVAWGIALCCGGQGWQS